MARERGKGFHRNPLAGKLLIKVLLKVALSLRGFIFVYNKGQGFSFSPGSLQASFNKRI